MCHVPLRYVQMTHKIFSLAGGIFKVNQRKPQTKKTNSTFYVHVIIFSRVTVRKNPTSHSHGMRIILGDLSHWCSTFLVWICLESSMGRHHTGDHSKAELDAKSPGARRLLVKSYFSFAFGYLCCSFKDGKWIFFFHYAHFKFCFKAMTYLPSSS